MHRKILSLLHINAVTVKILPYLEIAVKNDAPPSPKVQYCGMLASGLHDFNKFVIITRYSPVIKAVICGPL